MITIYQSVSPYSISNHYGKRARLDVNICIDESNKISPTQIKGILKESSDEEIILEMDNNPLHIPLQDIQRVLVPKTIKILNVSDKGLILKL